MERVDIINKVRFKQQFEGGQSVSQVAIQRSILGRGNGRRTEPQRGQSNQEESSRGWSLRGKGRPIK